MHRVLIPDRLHWRVIGALLLVATAGLHAAAAPEHAEAALYIGILFVLNAAAGLLLAAALIRRLPFSWSLAALFAAVTVLLYVIARTTGLPAYKETDFVDAPYGLPSIVVESLLVVLFLALHIAALARPSGMRSTAPTPWAPMPPRRVAHGRR